MTMVLPTFRASLPLQADLSAKKLKDTHREASPK